MRLYSTIVYLSLAALSIFSCDNKRPEPPTKEIYGAVKSEHFTERITNANTYYFTVETLEGIKQFKCFGTPASEKMDALLDPKDKVKLRMKGSEACKQDNFSIDLENIVEINGKPFSSK